MRVRSTRILAKLTLITPDNYDLSNDLRCMTISALVTQIRGISRGHLSPYPRRLTGIHLGSIVLSFNLRHGIDCGNLEFACQSSTPYINQIGQNNLNFLSGVQGCSQSRWPWVVLGKDLRQRLCRLPHLAHDVQFIQPDVIPRLRLFIYYCRQKSVEILD